jgi:hypothetical protein
MKTAVLVAIVLLLGAGLSLAQVGLTASPTTTLLPDGQSAPMWGLFCAPGSNTNLATGPTCTALNGQAQTGTAWQPPLIMVPYTNGTASLTITLTHGLPAAVSETSLVIVGQLATGQGSTGTTLASPPHGAQGATWPIAAPPDTGGATAGNATLNPPDQGPRVHSFWSPAKAGTPATLTWSNLRPGTYLIESGTHPSIQVPMGLYGMVVVTTAPSGGTAGTAYPNVSYNGEVPLLFSEIDAVQNNAVNSAVAANGFSETTVWSGQPGSCGATVPATCYPPAVNYDPRYFLINGSSFDKTNVGRSVSTVMPSGATGNVLVRFVNAGLRMHIPSIVGAQIGTPALSGFSLIAEDGNPLPGTSRVQTEVFMPAGKTYDVMINAPASTGALPVFDRQLSLSTNNSRDGGMVAYIGNGGSPAFGNAAVSLPANAPTYYCVAGVTLNVSDPSKGVLGKVQNASGAVLSGTPSFPATDTFTFNSDGTFVYAQPSTNTSCGGTFTYLVDGTSAAQVATITECDASHNTGGCPLGTAPTAVADVYPASHVASKIHIAPPGLLANDTDGSTPPLTLTAALDSSGCNVAGATQLTSSQVTLNADGSFTASPSGAAGTYFFCYHAVNSHKTASNVTSASISFPAPSHLQVVLKDGKSGAILPNDYRWIIEEDRTFQIDPATQLNSGAATPVPSLGTNFHTSYMPVIASGCVGSTACESGQMVFDNDPTSPTYQQHVNAACDIGNGVCHAASQKNELNPSQVALDPTKHYYISVLPGDAANPFNAGNTSTPTPDCFQSQGGNPPTCGHTMGGGPITPAMLTSASPTVTVMVEPYPAPTAKVSVFVFEDDSPLNGEVDVHGGTEAMSSSKEPGLGGFEITLFDDAGGTGDATGQPTYDMFNNPLSNSLQGLIDPSTGADACPISRAADTLDKNGKMLSTDGLIGMIVTCPAFESDGVTPSPLVGQAVIANLYPGRYGVVATPAADRIGRGEQWLQTNTLDGQKGHDAFIKVGGPSYFQEFGPAGYHVAIGMANPAIINNRGKARCASAGVNCNNSVQGKITNLHYSRPPNENLYGAGTRDSLGFTQCYVSLGDTDGDDIQFTRCDGDGNFSFGGVPDGIWRITIFDQWNDQIVDGLASAVQLSGGQSKNLGEISVLQWHTNLYTTTFLDTNGNGVQDNNEPGLTLVPTNVRFRDGSFSNFNNTDLFGSAGFNEIFPLFNWYVVETDSTRYKPTKTHVAYDAGGQVDSSGPYAGFASTTESIAVPADLQIPGATYTAGSTQRIDPNVAAQTLYNVTGVACTSPGVPAGCNPDYGKLMQAPGQVGVATEGWQGYSGQNDFIDFGKAPFAEAATINGNAVPAENGGIHGMVVYYSTRPFDDTSLDLQLSWTPGVPNVTVNLYQETTAADGTKSLTLIDTTKSASWDDWAQGFHSTSPNGTKIPNMSCPGQSNDLTQDPFFFTLQNSPNWLDSGDVIPHNSQFKCYDGMHAFNQVQPAVYDGYYQFPSAAYAAAHPLTANQIAAGHTLVSLPAGKYVVEVVVPPGYELVKEEDKNILIGDNYIAPALTQFGGLASIFIMPDQAAVNSTYNPNNPQNPTQDLGAFPRHEGDTGSVESYWPCVGAERIVPDFISLFPQSGEVSPFAGATRHLCDRKEVILEDQMSVLAKFYLFTSTHVAAHFTGFMLDDFSSEFDPFSPQFGEKFAIPNVPISIKNFDGVEVSRLYSDQWGIFNGLNYSTWEVNPPNPTGYAPTMMVACMNDPGPIPDPAHPGQMIIDPSYNQAYSQFCYEIPFMPGQTQYMDTPVVPVSAFADGYNPPDCAYPDTTPAIKEVDGNGVGSGPWASGSGSTLIITALGDDPNVPNPAYNGPAASTAPFNKKYITRHYGFGGATGSVALMGSDGVVRPLTVGAGGWNDGQITATIPAAVATGLPFCQKNAGDPARASYGRCGELIITRADGRKSIDTVTVTIGGTASKVKHLAAGQTIQSAIDAATPGDLIMIPPGNYNEMLLMWKPVRLQGVGAYSVVVNASTHPSGKMDDWRKRVNCLFGLALNGFPISKSNPYDPNDAPGTSSCQFVNTNTGNATRQVDPIPLEPLNGWDANLNGNLAELLQEPTLMGAYEGAGITIAAKGLANYPTQGVCDGLDATGCIPLNGSFNPPINIGRFRIPAGDCYAGAGRSARYSPNNFFCAPSRVDGITFTDSSQGGGGIFAHGWTHNLEIANNRVRGNAGTLTGGITIGQVEVPDATISGNGIFQLPFGFNNNVNVHHNAVSLNASYGDEINSTTPSSAGGVTFCSGADNYHFNYNWVCGNMSSGDGGGVAHFGFSYNGDISHNTVIFNQSNNPTLPTYGGGIIAQGVPPDGTFCENTTVDQDCAPQLSDGVGPNLNIDSNLIVGNTAESGKGGGLRLQGVNGTDIQRSPTNAGGTSVFNGFQFGNPQRWYIANVTNNIIANNVAGWSGAGVSLQDAVRVNFVNNTVVSNDATASSGVLFNTDAASQANVGPPNCVTNGAETKCNPLTTSTIQPAGLESARHTSNLLATFNPNSQSGCGPDHVSCHRFSNPLMDNNIFWQNRTFHIAVGGQGAGIQQNVVSLIPALNQAGHATGYCPAGAQYWDIGLFGDTGPANHSSGLTLRPRKSILTSTAGYITAGSDANIGSSPAVVSQYCNGARKNPEAGGLGFTVPPGISDSVLPNPLFGLLPSATPDEGNQWINMQYGPLSLSNGALYTSANTSMTALGNYSITAGSPARNAILASGLGSSPTEFANAPTLDFFGTNRKGDGNVDIGAVEFSTGTVGAAASVSPTSLDFGNVAVGSTSAAQVVTLTNNGTTGFAVSITPPAAPFAQSATTCAANLGSGASCSISVTFHPTAVGDAIGTLTVNGNAVALSGTGVVAQVNPTALDFGNVAVGTTSATQNLTVSNNGGSALNITGIVVTAPFARVNSGVFPVGAPNCGVALAAGANCTIKVAFAPTAAGSSGGTVTITASGTVTGSPVALTGTGFVPAPNASVDPTSLNFGSRPINTNSPNQTLTLINTGTGPLNGITVNVTAPFSRNGGTCGASLAAPTFNGPTPSCTINIRFRPTQRISYNGTVTISGSNGGVNGSPVELTGRGR